MTSSLPWPKLSAQGSLWERPRPLGVSVGDSPNTPGSLGVEDLEAGSMGDLCCNPRTVVFSGLPLLFAVHVEMEIIPPGNRQ